MKIALIADAHLSDLEQTPQESALNWALEALKEAHPDAALWLGDMTACGSPDAALRLDRKLASLPVPSAIVPGNSDLRTEATAPMMERFLFNYPEGLKIKDLHIVGFDNAHDRILPEERARLSRLATGDRILLFSHEPAKYMDADSVEFLRRWAEDRTARGQRILLWASGHRHHYEVSSWEGIPIVSVRALDPDKCRGGEAQICLWDSESGEFDELCYPTDPMTEWSEEERLELSDCLGITCYSRSKVERDMPFAIAHGVKHLEWRKIKQGELALLEQWRRAGGKTFSLHMSALDYKDGVIGKEELVSSALDAVRAGADMITVHPPQISYDQMKIGLPAFEATADAMAEAFLPVVAAGIDILVENNHTDHDTPNVPDLIPYGCTPIDIVGWRNALNERLGRNACHLRLDVGHARNNMPLSEPYPIGKWFASIGGEANAYHLHQTAHDKVSGRMTNHHPILGWHNGFVAFDGFLGAWKNGTLRKGPVILEIREGEGAPATWLRLQSLLLGKDL